MQNIGISFGKSTGECKSLALHAQGLPPDHSGTIAAFKAYGVEVAPSKYHSSYQPWALDKDDRKTSAQALGGAVGWSIRAQADAKSAPPDRRLLSRMCEVGRASKGAHEAVRAVQRALPPLAPGASALQRLTRLEVLREGGRAITREFPHEVVKVNTSLGHAIGMAGSPPEVTALAHGISLELRHQGIAMPTGQYWWGDLGDGVNIPVAAGLKMTHSLSAGSGLPADLRTMPLEQALLHLSSLRYHLRASDWDIDELAGQIRRRPDITDDVEEAIDAMVPVAGAFAAHLMPLEARYSCQTREDLERYIEQALRDCATHPSSCLFTTAADVFVRTHRYLRGQDEVTEADFLTCKGVDAFEAYERVLDFYDRYHQFSVAPLLAQARQVPRPAGLQRRLERHAQVLRQELDNLAQRPYIREALQPFSGDKAPQVQSLRNRLQHPLSRVEAALRLLGG